jgi:hypothetical protein
LRATATADALSLHPKTLTKYINRIESELSRQFVHRNASAPHAITALTTDGLSIAGTITEAPARHHNPAIRKR